MFCDALLLIRTLTFISAAVGCSHFFCSSSLLVFFYKTVMIISLGIIFSPDVLFAFVLMLMTSLSIFQMLL